MNRKAKTTAQCAPANDREAFKTVLPRGIVGRLPSQIADTLMTDGGTNWFIRIADCCLSMVIWPDQSAFSNRQSAITIEAPMILELTDAQKAFQERIAEFARDRLAPRAAGIDEQGAFPTDLVAELAGLGLMGVTVSPEWGGAGLDYVSYALAIEALASASAVVAVIAAVNNSLVTEPLLEFGTDTQKQTWLRRLTTGESLGAFALSEE